MDDISIRADGVAEAMFAEQPAWHGLGEVVSAAPDSATAIRKAHLDYRVRLQHVYITTSPIVGQTLPAAQLRRIRDRRAIVREDTGQVFGVVSDRYQPVQNEQAFAFMDSLHQDGILKYESAFALGRGERVCIMARMPQVDYVGPQRDPLLRYLLLSTQHDGAGAINVLPTSVRVVCANTLALAMGDERRNRRGMSLRHTGNMQHKLDCAREMLDTLAGHFATFADRVSKLAEVRLGPESTVAEKKAFEAYLQTLLPAPEDSGARVAANRIEEQRATARRAYWGDSRQALIAGTWWAALNAITQTVDHATRKGRDAQARAESRFRVTQTGDGAALKTRALVLAEEIATA